MRSAWPAAVGRVKRPWTEPSTVVAEGEVDLAGRGGLLAGQRGGLGVLADLRSDEVQHPAAEDLEGVGVMVAGEQQQVVAGLCLELGGRRGTGGQVLRTGRDGLDRSHDHRRLLGMQGPGGEGVADGSVELVGEVTAQAGGAGGLGAGQPRALRPPGAGVPGPGDIAQGPVVGLTHRRGGEARDPRGQTR